MENKLYKVKINKDILSEFFTTDKVTQRHLDELYKIVNIIMIKHYSKYSNLFEELRQAAVMAVTQRRSSYDPSYSAYNYVYTVFRNEIGNTIIKLTKETSVEDYLSYREKVVDSSEAELPVEIERYHKFLTGEEKFSKLRIPKKDVLNLILFLKKFETRRDSQTPTFIYESKKYTTLMYKMLKDLI